MQSVATTYNNPFVSGLVDALKKLPPPSSRDKFKAPWELSAKPPQERFLIPVDVGDPVRIVGTTGKQKARQFVQLGLGIVPLDQIADMTGKFVASTPVPALASVAGFAAQATEEGRNTFENSPMLKQLSSMISRTNEGAGRLAPKVMDCQFTEAWSLAICSTSCSACASASFASSNSGS